MRRLELDFMHPGGRRPRLGWLLLAATLLWAAWLGAQAMQQRQAWAAAESQAGQRRAQAPRVAKVAPDPATQAATAREMLLANQAVAALNLPWEQLFAQLEALKMPQVQLMALQPDTSGGARRLRLVARTRRLDDALAYAARAAQAPGFVNVHLQSHETLIDEQQQTAAVQFTLALEWVGRP